MEEKHYLYWAIQSSQSVTPTEQELELFQAKYKEDYQQDIVYEGEELLEKFRLHGFRNPLFSSLTSIILAFENGGEMRVKYIVGEEKDLLQTFTNLLRNSFQGYNLINFDSEILLPFLNVRLHKNEFLNIIHHDLKYQGGMRSWNFTGISIKDYYKGGGKYSFSLKEIAYILNIDSKGIINHRDEFNYVNSGNEEALKLSAIKQVEVMAEIWRKLNNLPKLETVLIEEKVVDVVEEESTGIILLKTLYRSPNIDNKTKEELKSLLSKKKILKKDKVILEEMLISIYINNKMFEADDAKVKERKKQEIKALLDEY